MRAFCSFSESIKEVFVNLQLSSPKILYAHLIWQKIMILKISALSPHFSRYNIPFQIKRKEYENV